MPTQNTHPARADSVADIPTLMTEVEHLRESVAMLEKQVSSQHERIHDLQARIRQAKAITTGNNRHIYGNDFEAGMARALWLVHQILGKDRDE